MQNFGNLEWPLSLARVGDPNHLGSLIFFVFLVLYVNVCFFFFFSMGKGVGEGQTMVKQMTRLKFSTHVI